MGRAVIARLPRPLANVFALLLAVACAWCLTASPPPIKTAKKGGYTDVRLYRDIATEVGKGKGYYLAAAELQRQHHYPLKPFVTVRPPALVWLAAQIGWDGLQKLGYALSALSIFAWVVAFERTLDWTERVLVAVAVGAGCSAVVSVGVLALHEYWTGWFTSLALAGAIGWPRKWGLVLLPVALGLAVRELTLPFALLALAFAVWERHGREAVGWIVLISAFALGLALHAGAVNAVVQAGDITSPGWKAMQGLSGFLKAVVFTSLLQDLPLNLALLGALLPMVGWLALPGRAGLFALLFEGGFALMIALFSRADTFYWGAIMLPHYFVGFALLPRALWQLAQAVRFPPPARKPFPIGAMAG